MSITEGGDLPTAVWSGEFTISGVTLHCHVLSNGRRIIESRDIEALFEAWANGAEAPDKDTSDVQELAKWIRDCI